MKPNFIIFSTFFVTLFVFGFNASAQTTCSSVVSYMLSQQEQKDAEIFFGEIKARGSDETTTKSKIETEILKARIKALERCKSQYENTSGCLQAKLSASSAVFQSSSFAARKALEDALLADCKKQQGVCKEVKVSEVKCLATADAAQAASAKTDPKKDEKAKK